MRVAELVRASVGLGIPAHRGYLARNQDLATNGVGQFDVSGYGGPSDPVFLGSALGDAAADYEFVVARSGVQHFKLLCSVEAVDGLDRGAIERSRVGCRVENPREPRSGALLELAVEVVDQGAAGVQGCGGVGPVEHHAQHLLPRGDADANGVGSALGQGVAHKVVLFDRTSGAKGVHSPVAVDEVGTVLAEVVGGVHEDGLHESAVRILAAVRLAVGIVQLGEHAGGSGAGH